MNVEPRIVPMTSVKAAAPPFSPARLPPKVTESRMIVPAGPEEDPANSAPPSRNTEFVSNRPPVMLRFASAR